MTKALGDHLSQDSTAQRFSPPKLYNLAHKIDQHEISLLFDTPSKPRVIDTYDTQLREYFVLEHPQLHMDPPREEKQFSAYRDEHYGKHEPWQIGTWIYLPWRHAIIHALDDEQFQTVRTGRNRNLITAEEQHQYYHSTIGIGGLSVGNSIALAIVLTGGGKNLKLADPDTLELTNLNRIRSSIAELTEPKVHMTARQIYELDPYANITLYPEGLSEDNTADFFNDLDLVIDEIDHLGMKLVMRDAAKKHRIPLLMATDNGDSGLLDIERHDLDEDIPYFHGRIDDNDIKEMLSGELPLPLIGKKIGEKLVGFDITEPRMQQSLLAIGKTIPTWPQLGGAALLNGVAVAAAARKILTNQPVIDNRTILSLSSWLIPGYDSAKSVKQRKQDTEQFAKDYSNAINEFLEDI